MQRRAKILLVDDDVDLVEATKTVLEANSFEVITAYNGEDGLKKVVEERPDLIILDVIMPGRHGFEICKELKTDPKYHFFAHIPVLMLTVYPERREEAHLSLQEGMAMEAEDYIQKPVTPEQLLERVQEMLERI